MFVLILCLTILSLLFLALHLLSARHRSVHLAIGSLLLIGALTLIPFYVNDLAAAGDTTPLSLPEIIEFYGTVLGLVSSCVLGYVAFRISRNDHKRHNSSCVSISSVQCRPIYVVDKSFARIHTDPSHRKRRFADLAAAWAAFRSADATTTADPHYKPKQPDTAATKDGSFNYNVQKFKTNDENEPIIEVGKLANEATVRLGRGALRRQKRLEKTVSGLKAKKKLCPFGRARLVLTERRLQRYQDYTTLPDTLKRNVLSFCISNQGPSALQQILITFPRNNYRFTCYVSFPEQTTRYKYIILPDDCQLDDVLQITFISCYNERTYGEFKLNSVKPLPISSLPENMDKAEPKYVEESRNRIYYTPKHFHYYGTQKQ